MGLLLREGERENLAKIGPADIEMIGRGTSLLTGGH